MCVSFVVALGFFVAGKLGHAASSTTMLLVDRRRHDRGLAAVTFLTPADDAQTLAPLLREGAPGRPGLARGPRRGRACPPRLTRRPKRSDRGCLASRRSTARSLRPARSSMGKPGPGVDMAARRAALRRLVWFAWCVRFSTDCTRLRSLIVDNEGRSFAAEKRAADA